MSKCSQKDVEKFIKSKGYFQMTPAQNKLLKSVSGNLERALQKLNGCDYACKKEKVITKVNTDYDRILNEYNDILKKLYTAKKNKDMLSGPNNKKYFEMLGITEGFSAMFPEVSDDILGNSLDNDYRELMDSLGNNMKKQLKDNMTTTFNTVRNSLNVLKTQHSYLEDTERNVMPNQKSVLDMANEYSELEKNVAIPERLMEYSTETLTSNAKTLNHLYIVLVMVFIIYTGIFLLYKKYNERFHLISYIILFNLMLIPMRSLILYMFSTFQ